MTTAGDLIKLSLKVIGAIGQGQTPRQEQINDALLILNMMIGQWNRKRWLIPHLVESKLQATGALSYSVGPGGDFNIPRPDQIEDCFIRLNNNLAGIFNSDFSDDFQTIGLANGSDASVDYPIKIIRAREDYDRIPIKKMGAFPYYAFYDSGYPLGKIYFWPVPSFLYEMHILVKGALQAFPDVTTVINLPPEYIEPLYYNLAGRLAPTYGLEPKPVVVALAAAGLNTLRQANTQIPSLRLPGVLTRNTRGASLPTFVGKPGI